MQDCIGLDNPMRDLQLISPYSITPESYIKVMRMKEMITN